MCTVSWRFQRDGYELFFNRDEQRTRPAGEPPRLHRRDENVWVAPHDPQGGGSWIITNSHGLTACVLNAYGISTTSIAPRPTTSRGQIPPTLAAATDLDSARSILESMLLPGTFAPCFVLCLSPNASAAWWIWNGTLLHRVGGTIHPPLTTSSCDSASVIRIRREAFRQLIGPGRGATSRELRLFHECPGQSAHAASVRMSRPDARTVSLTRVIVDSVRICMTYAERDGDDGFRPAVECPLPRTAPEPEAI